MNVDSADGMDVATTLGRTTLEKSVAVVTGAGRGIGEAIALRLGLDGATVVACDLDEDRARSTATAINKATGRVESWAHAVDVTESIQVRELVRAIMDKTGKIDILVNNAGIGDLRPFEDMDQTNWHRVINVNLNGTYLCCRHVVPVMVNQTRGKIINIASTAGLSGPAMATNYAASKFGVVGLTQSLAQELGGHHIQVNAVCPGIVFTDFWSSAEDLHQKYFGHSHETTIENIVKTIPLGRCAVPADIAKAVAFFASSDADYITGQALSVCGGFLMH